jgi:hypothetical protein
MREEAPRVVITIKDDNGNIVRHVRGRASKGIHRVNWNLRYASQNVVSLNNRGGGGGWFGGGFMALPGTYTATLASIKDGEYSTLSEPISFDVVPLREATLEGIPFAERKSFQDEVVAFQRKMTQMNQKLNKQMNKVDAMRRALNNATEAHGELMKDLYDAHRQLLEFQERLEGSEAKNEVGERNLPSPGDRMFVGMRGLNTTYGPTQMHMETVEAGLSEFAKINQQIDAFEANVMRGLSARFNRTDAPPIEQ